MSHTKSQVNQITYQDPVCNATNYPCELADRGEHALPLWLDDMPSILWETVQEA